MCCVSLSKASKGKKKSAVDESWLAGTAAAAPAKTRVIIIFFVGL